MHETSKPFALFKFDALTTRTNITKPQNYMKNAVYMSFLRIFGGKDINGIRGCNYWGLYRIYLKKKTSVGQENATIEVYITFIWKKGRQLNKRMQLLRCTSQEFTGIHRNSQEFEEWTSIEQRNVCFEVHISSKVEMYMFI